MRRVSVNLWDPWWLFCWPVMLILADHLDVPSKTLCLTCFIWVTWVVLGTPNTSWMSSKISGLFLSRIFMRSFRTMIMFWVRSSAPCLELFSAAPERNWKVNFFLIQSSPTGRKANQLKRQYTIQWFCAVCGEKQYCMLICLRGKKEKRRTVQTKENWDNSQLVLVIFCQKKTLLCKQSALSRSWHFSWHLTPHSVQRIPWRAIPHSSPSHS